MRQFSLFFCPEPRSGGYTATILGSEVPRLKKSAPPIAECIGLNVVLCKHRVQSSCARSRCIDVGPSDGGRSEQLYRCLRRVDHDRYCRSTARSVDLIGRPALRPGPTTDVTSTSHRWRRLLWMKMLSLHLAPWRSACGAAAVCNIQRNCIHAQASHDMKHFARSPTRPCSVTNVGRVSFLNSETGRSPLPTNAVLNIVLLLSLE